MNAKRRNHARRAAIATTFLAMVFAVGYQTRGPGSLDLLIIDGTGGPPTPARVELLDQDRTPRVADDALPTNGDCMDRAEALRMPLERAVSMLSKSMINPYTKTTQFYSIGHSLFTSLPAGTYKLKIHKGPEFNVEERELQIRPFEHLKVVVPLSRWIDLAGQGWYSSDDHMHIARPVEGLNPFLSKWMQAEDVHIANFLQWGNSRVFHNTLQYAFGKASLYREGDYLLATGQENPRTHFRGHTIILGAELPISFPSAYLIYTNFFEEARRQGALSGYAHRGTWLGAPYGLAIDLPSGLLNFLEVLQQGNEEWTSWYEILNSGFRLTPTAGTDYPCLASYPGRERFYTKVEGSLAYDTWLEGVRRGRTFVTNGPVLDFRVNGKEMGEEVRLERPGTVTIDGRVRFDTKRDEVQKLELVESGQVVGSFPRLNSASEISVHIPYQVRESSWLALRARGLKRDEAAVFSSISLAHSAPIYLTLKNSSQVQSPLAKLLARTWLARLDDLEGRLAEDQLKYLAQSGSDGVTEAILRRDRAALIEQIKSARMKFSGR
jgi:hypothetical protein